MMPGRMTGGGLRSGATVRRSLALARSRATPSLLSSIKTTRLGEAQHAADALHLAREGFEFRGVLDAGHERIIARMAVSRDRNAPGSRQGLGALSE